MATRARWRARALALKRVRSASSRPPPALRMAWPQCATPSCDEHTNKETAHGGADATRIRAGAPAA